MSNNILSLFIDESGDFGPLEKGNSYYHVAIVFHEQKHDISKEIASLNEQMNILQIEPHAIHTGPLIRREGFYKNDYMERRKKLFNCLYHFARKVQIGHICPYIDKKNCDTDDELSIVSNLSKALATQIKALLPYIMKFDSVIVYYDNGQIELTKILTSLFNALLSNVEFRKVKPFDYKLFQVADLICTAELLKKKADSNTFSRSESEFFGSARDFKKNIYKQLLRKKLQ